MNWIDGEIARPGICCLGSSTSSSGSSQGTVPPGLQPFEQLTQGEAGAAANAGFPILMSEFGASPEQIAPLTPLEHSLITSLGAQGSPSNPLMIGAENELSALTSGPIGSSPATTAAMTAWNLNNAPQAEQAATLSGAGRGGGDTEALVNARSAAYTPLVEQEIANRENAVGQYSSLAGQQSALSSTGLQAAELPQQTAQAQNEANYQDLLRRYGLAQSTTIDPFYALLTGLLGSQQQSSGTTTPSIFSLF